MFGTAAVLAAAAVLGAARAEPHYLSDEFIDMINKGQDSWVAKRNFPADTPDEYLLAISNGVLMAPPDPNIEMVVHDQDFIATLPESFDPTSKWPNCPSLKEIRNQNHCGSCWAFGAVETMTDRVCTYSNGTNNFHFSAEDLLTCCASKSCQTVCCDGGSPALAFQFWVSTGIVSGGPYKSGQGCQPYLIPPQRDNASVTPPCKHSCQNGQSYSADKHFGKRAYSIPQDEGQIRAELYKNGPVEATFYVYEDFYHYNVSVYFHKYGVLKGGHAVKILGWGVENGQKYWLIANSWGTAWGGLGGFFKMLRGVNECNIESNIQTGEPKQ